MDEVTLNAKAVLRKAMELILSDHQQQYGGKQRDIYCDLIGREGLVMS